MGRLGLPMITSGRLPVVATSSIIEPTSGLNLSSVGLISGWVAHRASAVTRTQFPQLVVGQRGIKAQHSHIRIVIGQLEAISLKFGH